MDIIFNSLNLNDAVNYFVENSNHEDVATQEVDVQKIARTNESVFLRKNYGTRVMKMKVIVKDTTSANLDSRLDIVRQTVEASGKNLDIDYAGGTRRYVCTGFIKGIDRRLTWAIIEIEFQCYQAFGEDTSSTTESFLDKTTNPYADDIEIGGSANAQPDIQITINSLTAADEKFIQLKNTDNGDYIKVSANDWAADDVIIISTRNATVSRNGTIVEYLGIMPEWIPGDNNWEYTDDFDARQVDIQFSYKKRYL
ncbi:MAG TPA: hypothetical protein DDY21_00205 [Candidatus Moranbacteria bacterium]|nr:hypothetical protein [Candidatus Moranbacteria bacterium]